MKGTDIVIKGLSKSYNSVNGEDSLKVLDEVYLHIKQGEFVSIVGPSGCGKSTLLNILAGFESGDDGVATCCREKIEGVSTQRAVVFQSPVLFPWLSVRKNVLFGLKQKKMDDGVRQKLVDKYLDAVGISDFEHYYPGQLSGGMQQRVALARVLVLDPNILLMDEPFASLDAQSRLSMQELLLDLWNKQKPTVIFVTHDVEEALFLSDKVFIMTERPGRIKEEIDVTFKRPRNISVIGTPEFSELKKHVLSTLMSIY
ncbi:ABC transporter ATP-binding protein [Methanosalsum natronophilum]|uniref:ABC transporter ATP-binding protein n=1 Tax=Methanosalsum natronophilum TaxID=768733 RepID=A0A3R7VU29_9EURY|nr:ABC transporter ATP-binding protein [Methanosalsum natronophilum]MCS3923856.1 NitT/TauT family transport system ATP-binding protein [Methanosalsum natronophilum]RQD89126.1 MAG: ABC transporter ATP-binding protein [Methanosalsum natronophilum]